MALFLREICFSSDDALIIKKCRTVGFYLRPNSQEAAAVRSSTFTHGLPIAATFQVVVEIQLHTLNTHLNWDQAAFLRQVMGFSSRQCAWRKAEGRSMSVKPWGMSCRANRPTRVSPFTVHFWVSQFGWQQWFMKRAWFPLGPASMTRSCETAGV